MFNFMRHIPLFSGLPEGDLWQLCEYIAEVELEPGEELFEEGSPGAQAYVIREGEVEIIKAGPNGEVLLAVRGPKEVIGEMALLESAPRMATVRARTKTKLYTLSQDQFENLLATSPSAANAMFRTILERWRNTQGKLRQSEKMAQLGTLTAGVAHELNNPAAAVKRAAGQLEEVVGRYASSQQELGGFELSADQLQVVSSLSGLAREKAAQPAQLSSLDRSDRQEEMEDWLDNAGVENAWEFAPALVDLGFTLTDLETLDSQFSREQLAVLVEWLCSSYTAYSLLHGISMGAGRISEIVKALKSYSYLDQAPVQNVNIHQGLDDTLVILQNKLKSGIVVHREYDPDLPAIQAYGSELNQVWTNIIDNAIYALDGKGEITIRTRHEDGWIIVEIEDNGPGIPEEAQPRVFDPFFTTKPPGVGTGLGLDISYNIVAQKHRGNIRFDSVPGKTTFEISLPMNFEK